MEAIRRAKPEDKDWIKAIYDESKQIWNGFSPTWYWSMERGDGTQWLVIEGHAFVHYRQRKKDNVYVVYEVAVAHASHRNGYGKHILDALPGVIELKTDRGNKGAQRFYESIGFIVQGITQTKGRGKKPVKDMVMYRREWPVSHRGDTEPGGETA